MTESGQQKQGLSDAGCGAAVCTPICSLFEAGNTIEPQRCELLDEMQKSQRKIDQMDDLVHTQEKCMK